MAEDIAKAAVEAGSKAVMDLSLSAGAFSISLKIDNVWLAGAVSVGALSLGAFYLACKGPTEGAIRRALERKIFGVEDPAVMNITDGHSILVELRCSTESSFLVLFEDLETNSAKFRLEEEFKNIGFKSDLDVTIRNAETVYKHVSQIRGRYRAEREVWKQKYKELANMVNRMHENVALAPQANDTQTSTRADETLNRVQQLEAYFSGKAQYGETGRQGPDDSTAELDCVQEKLRREMAISMGMRRTIERLQEENKRLQSISERVRNDGMELKDQVKTRSEENKIEKRVVLELREKVHELEKENELLQQKLKRKDKELERFQSTETDDIVPESRPRASSGTSLGASSGYQSEEDPDESSEVFFWDGAAYYYCTYVVRISGLPAKRP